MFLESFSVAVSGIIGIALGTKKTDLELSHGFCHSESDPKSALTAGCSSSHTRIDQIRVELCNAKYAKDILMTNPEVSTLMPCAWGVYKGKDGKIYISGMNMGLMGKMFGGNIAKVMGEAVSKDEEQMLKEVIRE